MGVERYIYCTSAIHESISTILSKTNTSYYIKHIFKLASFTSFDNKYSATRTLSWRRRVKAISCYISSNSKQIRLAPVVHKVTICMQSRRLDHTTDHRAWSQLQQGGKFYDCCCQFCLVTSDKGLKGQTLMALGAVASWARSLLAICIRRCLLVVIRAQQHQTFMKSDTWFAEVVVVVSFLLNLHFIY